MGSIQHTQQTRARVIQEFLNCGRVDLACARAGVDRSCHYDWLKRHADYRQAFMDARNQTADLLEDEAFRRAHEGMDKPVYQQGQCVGYVREYSDTLMTWLLRGLRPERYNEKLVLAGDPDAPLQISIAEQIRQRRAKLRNDSEKSA